MKFFQHCLFTDQSDSSTNEEGLNGIKKAGAKKATRGVFYTFSSTRKRERMRYLSVVLVVAALLRIVPAGEDGAEKKDKENIGTVIGIDLGTTYSW